MLLFLFLLKIVNIGVTFQFIYKILKITVILQFYSFPTDGLFLNVMVLKGRYQD